MEQTNYNEKNMIGGALISRTCKPIHRYSHKVDDNSCIMEKQGVSMLRYNGNNNKLSIKEHTLYIINNNTFRKKNDILYVYDKNNCYYVPILVNNYESLIRGLLPLEYCWQCDMHLIRELFSMLMYLKNSMNEIIYSGSPNIFFNNGCYNIEKGNFENYNPSIFNTYKLPIEYISENIKVETSVFDNFLNQVSCGDTVKKSLLLEHLAYVISDVRCLKLITILYGPSNTGKSIWLDILAHVVGMYNITNIPMEQLANNFMTSNLINSRLNMYSEIGNKRIDNIYILKAISGNDSITCDVKYGSPISFKSDAALVFATNTLHPLRDVDPGNALFERFLIIPFYNQISRKNQDPFLIDKLKHEIPMVIKKYIIDSGLILKLHHNKYNFTFTDKAMNIKQELLHPLNSVELFTKDYLCFIRGMKVYKQEILEAYVDYCYKKKLKPSSKNELWNYLESLHILQHITPIVPCRFRRDGQNLNGYLNVELKRNI